MQFLILATQGQGRGGQGELESPFHGCPLNPERKVGFSQVMQETAAKAEHLAFLLNKLWRRRWRGLLGSA